MAAQRQKQPKDPRKAGKGVIQAACELRKWGIHGGMRHASPEIINALKRQGCKTRRITAYPSESKGAAALRISDFPHLLIKLQLNQRLAGMVKLEQQAIRVRTVPKVEFRSKITAHGHEF